MESKHTKGHWYVQKFKDSVCIFSIDNPRSIVKQYFENEPQSKIDISNSEHIVKCVNAHHELVNILSRLTVMTRFVEDNTLKGCGFLSILKDAEDVLKKVTDQ